jgi:hypothetical protein
MAICLLNRAEYVDFKTFLNGEYSASNVSAIQTFKDVEKIKLMWNPCKLKVLSISCWITSGILLTSPASAKTSVWNEMQPVFGVFQDLAMVLGAIAIIVGLTIMMFKKNTGWKIASTAGLVVLGVFLVPAVIMLVAIIGGMLNDILQEAFMNSNLRDSVKVGN